MTITQLDYVFFFYGFGFVVLAAICFLNAGRNAILPWRLLGFFGLTHGLNEWLDMLALSVGDSPAFRALRIGVMAISFIFLVEFGRSGLRSISGRGPRAWATVVLLALGCAGWIHGWAGLNVTLRYSLCFVGALWSALAVAKARRAECDLADRRTLGVLAVLFASYGVAAGLIGPEAPFAPASMLNQELFARHLGFPIQLLRGLLALASAICVGWMLGMSRTGQGYRVISAISVLVILALGWLLTDHVGVTRYRGRMESTLSTCSIAAASMDPEVVRGIDSADDLQDPRYRLLKRRLMEMRQTSPECRYIYVVVARGDRILFAADSEPSTSADCSPAGSGYTDAPKELRALCRGVGSGAVAEYEDRWGEWVSSFVPIQGTPGGKPIAFLGMDYPRATVYSDIYGHRLVAISVTLLVATLAIVLFYFRERRERFIDSIQGAADSLRENEEHLLCTLQSIGDAVITADCNGRITRLNPAAEALTGWESGEAVGKPVFEVFHIVNAVTREPAVCPIAKVLTTGRCAELAVDTVVVSKSGVERRIADSCSPIVETDGRIIGAVLVFRDVTEEHLQRERLIESESRWQFALTGAGDGVWDWNVHTGRVFFSTQWKAMLGYDDDEIGDGLEEWDSRVHPDDKARCYEDLDRHFRGDSPIFQNEHRLLCRDGSYRWILDRGKVLERTSDGKPLRVMGTHSDITDRKRTEDALRESKERFDQLAEQSRTFAWEVDADGLFTYVGHVVQLVLGYRPEELVGRMHFYDLHPVDGREAFRAAAFAVFGRDERFKNVENVVLSKDGEQVWLSTNGIPLLNPDGSLRGYRGSDSDITERKRAEEALKESEERFRSMFDRHNAVMLLVCADTGAIVDANVAAARFYGYPREVLRSMNASEINAPSAPEVSAEMWAALDGASDLLFLQHQLANGDMRFVELHLTPIRVGKQQLLFCIIHDVTDRLRAERSLRESESLQRLLLENTDAGVVIIDAETHVIELVNRKGSELFGRPDENITGHVCHSFMCPAERGKCPVTDLGQRVENSDRMLVKADGGMLPIAKSVRRVSIGGREKLLETFVDITQLKEAERALARANADLETSLVCAHELKLQAENARQEAEDRAARMDYESTHDTLTGLSNRREYERRVTESIALASSGRSSFAVLFMDLDKFKLVNDSLGHEIGDILLVECGKRLRACIRASDVVARMGGDEFTAIISAGRDPRSNCEKAIDRILDQLSRPYDICGHRLTIGISIGVAQYPDDGSDSQTLMKHADAAMYSAKQAGRGTVRWYSGDMETDVGMRLSAENDLSRAVERDELRVLYQPIMNLADGTVHGFEALLRWEHATRGMISPGLFIPLAEETGLINGIGDYVLRTACAQMKSWLDEGIELSHCAVNVSIVQLKRDSWVQSVAAALGDTGLDPRRLVIELTETIACQTKDLGSLISGLTEIGVRLAIDDFGVGHSSLGRLREIRSAHVKLDGTFLRNESAVEAQARLLRSVIQMIHEQDASVTAEWVETEEQNDSLREMGCDFAQGYFHSRPITAEQFREFAITHAKPGRRRAA